MLRLTTPAYSSPSLANRVVRERQHANSLGGVDSGPHCLNRGLSTYAPHDYGESESSSWNLFVSGNSRLALSEYRPRASRRRAERTRAMCDDECVEPKARRERASEGNYRQTNGGILIGVEATSTQSWRRQPAIRRARGRRRAPPSAAQRRSENALCTASRLRRRATMYASVYYWSSKAAVHISRHSELGGCVGSADDGDMT
ncbi:hypothetical protein EVAR_5056_1 [Eumeta japonica]|uniref:Uncharacterized protein n=1 Tax=Eumeta variegata TaxID=151549 RepID=A0A4C1SWN6_EUMVA|nr:hypothetical protein EVAR_5056_1 [Eumeta japonica]